MKAFWYKDDREEVKDWNNLTSKFHLSEIGRKKGLLETAP